MLLKPILHSRIGKWALALIEYSLTYQPLKFVKGQIDADFIVDHSVVEETLSFVDIHPRKLYFDGSRHKKWYWNWNLNCFSHKCEEGKSYAEIFAIDNLTDND